MIMHPDFWAKEAHDAQWLLEHEQRRFSPDPERVAYAAKQVERCEGACAATTLGEVLAWLGRCVGAEQVSS